MCVHVYVCACVCMYVWEKMCVCLCVSGTFLLPFLWDDHSICGHTSNIVCVCECMCEFVFLCMCVHAWVYACVCVCMGVYECGCDSITQFSNECVLARICIYVYVFMYTYTLYSVWAADTIETGGMMALTDVYCLFNRARGTELVSPHDLLHACELFEDEKLGM
jgi:hypothetical protein